MTAEEKHHYEALVLKRVPLQWRNDIRVDDVGEAGGDGEGHHVFVRISTASKLGRAQAGMSIGPYVRNDPCEWSTGWERHGKRYVFTAIQPSPHPQQQSLVELGSA